MLIRNAVMVLSLKWWFYIGRYNKQMIVEQLESNDEATVLKAVVVISKKKRYQIVLIVLLATVYHIFNIVMLSSSILFANPTFNCEGYPYPVEQDEACAILDFCRPKKELSLTAQLGFSAEKGINVMGIFGAIYFLVGFMPLFFLPNNQQRLYGEQTNVANSVK